MLSCMSMCFKWQMWNITDGQIKRCSFWKLPCKYFFLQKTVLYLFFLRWSRFWAVYKALLVVRNRKFAHLTIFRQFQTFPVRIWNFCKVFQDQGFVQFWKRVKQKFVSMIKPMHRETNVSSFLQNENYIWRGIC